MRPSDSGIFIARMHSWMSSRVPSRISFPCYIVHVTDMGISFIHVVQHVHVDKPYSNGVEHARRRGTGKVKISSTKPKHNAFTTFMSYGKVNHMWLYLAQFGGAL